jgi:hypothetical protein
MAEYNFLNLPAVHNAAQRSQINEQTRQLNEEKLTAIDEDKRLANTRFLAGSSKVLMDLWEKGEQDGFYAAAEELGPELVRRGIVDEEAWLQNKDKIGYDSVKQRYAQAMTALAGRPIVEAKPGDNVGKTWVNPDTGTMWGMRRSGQSFDTGVAAQQYAMKTVTVPLSDGTEMMVNYNPASGEGYDMQTGQTYIVRPSVPGNQKRPSSSRRHRPDSAGPKIQRSRSGASRKRKSVLPKRSSSRRSSTARCVPGNVRSRSAGDHHDHQGQHRFRPTAADARRVTDRRRTGSGRGAGTRSTAVNDCKSGPGAVDRSIQDADADGAAAVSFMDARMGRGDHEGRHRRSAAQVLQHCP